MVKGLPDDWNKELDKFYSEDKQRKLNQDIGTMYSSNSKDPVLPNQPDVFKCFELTPLNKVRCVIRGQDPYFNSIYRPNGLCFSIPNGIPLSSSLKRIFKEIYCDLGILEPPNRGNLTQWAENGVLLLNTALTVVKQQPKSHLGMWQCFTNAIIKMIADKTENTVFILFGKFAQNNSSVIDETKHLVLKCYHPVYNPPKATSGNSSDIMPLLGSKVFSKTNDYLLTHKKSPINWDLN